jgi:exodeoxyribonuclease VII small subunit
MPKKQESTFEYAAKSAELERVLAKLQDPDVEIDEATKLYDQGLKLVDEIETYLKQAENTVSRHVAGA